MKQIFENTIFYLSKHPVRLGLLVVSVCLITTPLLYWSFFTQNKDQTLDSSQQSLLQNQTIEHEATPSAMNASPSALPQLEPVMVSVVSSSPVQNSDEKGAPPFPTVLPTGIPTPLPSLPSPPTNTGVERSVSTKDPALMDAKLKPRAQLPYTTPYFTIMFDAQSRYFMVELKPDYEQNKTFFLSWLRSSEYESIPENQFKYVYSK